MKKVIEMCMRVFVTGVTAKGGDCEVVEWVKCDTMKWLGHVIRMKEDDLVKRI